MVVDDGVVVDGGAVFLKNILPSEHIRTLIFTN